MPTHRTPDASIMEQITKLRADIGKTQEDGFETVEQEFGATLILKGCDLREQREKLTTQTAANRDMLRGMHTQEQLTPEQITAVNVLYPVREAKAKENGSAPATAKDSGGSPPAAKK